jgi:PAS domain S-box-containing protein
MSTKKTGKFKKELEQAKESLISCETQHRNLIDYMRNGYAYCRMVEEEGLPVDFIHVEVNKGYVELTGLTDVVGKRITEVLPGIAESNPEFLEKHIGVAETGIPDQFEIYLETLKKWFEINVYSPQKGYTVAIFDDITKRKQVEQALLVSERKFRSITEQISEIVFVTDSSGYVTYVSPAITTLAGYLPDEVMGHLFTEFLAEEEMPGILAQWNDSSLRQLSSQALEVKYQRKNGTFFNGDVHVQIYHENGFSGMIGVIHDTTERKHNEEEQKILVREVIVAKEKAVENDKWKTEFLANISHDIRTPISGIFGFSDLLKDPHLSKEEQREYADIIHKSSEQMLHLINNFIDISCIEAGEAKPQVSQTPVNELLHDIYAFFKPQAEKRGLELRCSPGLPDNESTIETDNVKVRLILTNLVQNAMKFTGTGSIEIGYTKKESVLEFFVIDTGIGIPADKKEEIFGRYRQVYDAGTANSEGSGLGLNIARLYVAMLGGTIRVESEQDAGSKFVFTLPYTLPFSLNKQDPVSLTEPYVSFSSVTILIAEDDKVSFRLLKHYLKDENITILSAVNGHEAVVLVDYHPEINLVLIDLHMPLMDGYEATWLIKKLRPELPVIAQTAEATIETVKKVEKAGCDGFIMKPINKNELLEMIHELLNR